MAAGWAVRAEGLGKQYRLGESAGRPRSLYETLSDALAWARRRDGGRSRRGDLFWALRDVDFEIGRGEVVGVVGRNGAGKSTLLKILSRITTPTAGRVTLRGRLASLLEVGTGFHPELTGRENIFLNGTILGMRRREIERKFDDIVAFAEIDRFIETPVKRYSSGMYVRLAFAVAAHLDADILLVDEVLAVGDAAFQRKSLGKMEDVARSGRTVLFVSHNLGAVRALCPEILLLEEGRVVYRGAAEEGLRRYEAALSLGTGSVDAEFRGPLSQEIRFQSIALQQDGADVEIVDPERPVAITVDGHARRSFAELELNIGVFRDGCRLFSCHDSDGPAPMREGTFRSRFEIPAAFLRPGRYVLGLGAYRPGMVEWTWSPEVVAIEVCERWSDGVRERDVGAVNLPRFGIREQRQ